MAAAPRPPSTQIKMPYIHQVNYMFSNKKLVNTIHINRPISKIVKASIKLRQALQKRERGEFHS